MVPGWLALPVQTKIFWLQNRFFAKEIDMYQQYVVGGLRIIANIQVRGGSDLFYGEIKTELGLLAQSLVLSSTSQISAEELSSQSLCVLQETAAHIFLFYLFFLSSSEFVRFVIFKDFWNHRLWRVQNRFDIMTNISDATTLTSLFFNTSNTTPHPDSTVHPQPIDPALRTCNYFVISTNKTVVFDFNNHYGGKAYFWKELRFGRTIY